MAQTKPKAAQFYGVSGNGTAGQVLISDGNGGMSWGANTEQFTVSWSTPTGQSLTYTQPNPQSSQGPAGSAFPSTTFTVTPPSGEEISGTATIAGLPTGITASQSLSGTSPDNVLTVTLAGVFPGADSLNTALTLSGLTVIPPLTVNYLVVAGGGAGGGDRGGGGGAGGYLTNYGGTSLGVSTSTNYTVTIGAGGASSLITGASGNDSVFHTITSTGGGGGRNGPGLGITGGSGGGGWGASGAATNPGGIGNTPATTPSQGNNGGGGEQGGARRGGGGGGSFSAGSSGASGMAGGSGSTSNITGSSIVRAGGGGGGTSGGTGGSGGGGNGGNGSSGSAGATNTGSGGGGGGDGNNSGGIGGSGVIILRYTGVVITNPGSGLTFTTATVGSDKVTTFTAGTGNIQFN